MEQDTDLAACAAPACEERFGKDGAQELARPWPRYWARSFDTIIYLALLGAVLGIIFPELFYTELFESRLGEYLLTLMILPFAMLLDAAILSIWGTSPGKKIAGLSIVPVDSSDRSMERMMRRNLECYVRGMALGLPLLNLVAYYQSYQRMEIEGSAAWDDRSRTRVVSVPNEGGGAPG